ncbi:MAG: FAD:protein FMN transferase [Sedimenticola sp.]
MIADLNYSNLVNPLLRYLHVLLLITVAVGCSSPPTVHTQELYVFGTLVSISAYTSDKVAFEEAVDAVDASFQRMHRDWHAWKGEGELVQLNRAIAAGDTRVVDPFLLPLIEQAKMLSGKSMGLFNPAIGRLIALWGFHSDELQVGTPPSRDEIEALLQYGPEMTDLVIDGGQVSSHNRQVSIDLGAYAKGVALELAIKQLAAHGITHAIVNAGGDLCVAGRRGERPWRIGIRHPQGRGVIAGMEVEDGECLLTSGNYERYREYQQVRYAHIIDPRSGYPVEHIASATVVARDGGLADAAATALSVAGPSQWLEVSRNMGLKQVMLVDEKGRIYLTPEMEQRVMFQEKPDEIIIGRP